MTTWFEKHQDRLDAAREAIVTRKDWAAFAEIPSEKIYGEGAKKRAEEAFSALQNKPFDFQVPITEGEMLAGESNSPYGLELGISYPKVDKDTLLSRAQTAHESWRKVDDETRVGVCLEILQRLAEKSFVMAHAVMHTTGQPFVMSFQAGGPHALDRALEAIAYAYEAMHANAAQVDWEKVVGKNKQGEPIKAKLDKQFKTRGKGIGVVIGCATFPTWNSYPGIFADLATGNSVIIKPSENAILPLAIAVDTMRSVLKEGGFDPEIVQLAIAGADRPYTQAILTDPRVKMIDYTGSTTFGDWLQKHCSGKQLYLEQAGINNIFIESTDNYKGMLNNVAFSLSLFGGQMCTAPQNIYVPKEGIQTEQGHKTFAEVGEDIANSVSKLLSDENRAFAILGALNNQAVNARVKENDQKAQQQAKVLLSSEETHYEAFANASTAKPMLIALSADNTEMAQEEQFGPIAFVIASENREQALATLKDSIEQHGAMTTSFYSTDEDFKAHAIDVISDAGSPLSINLTGMIYVNQSAAYTDFHGSALNPAANTTLTDLGFVSQRFGWVTIREQQN